MEQKILLSLGSEISQKCRKLKTITVVGGKKDFAGDITIWTAI